jgi:hypothetical protein
MGPENLTTLSEDGKDGADCEDGKDGADCEDCEDGKNGKDGETAAPCSAEQPSANRRDHSRGCEMTCAGSPRSAAPRR